MASSKEVIEDNTDPRTIKIHIESISGLRAIYTYSDISIRVEFQSETILETEKVRLDEQIEIDQTVTLTFDLNDSASFDKYLSNPIVVTVTETEGHVDGDIQVEEARTGRALWHSEESILDLEEALLGAAKAEEVKDEKKKPGSKGSSKSKASKSSSKSSKSSKTSKTSKKSKKSKQKSAEAVVKVDLGPKGPQCAGFAEFDLVPLFMGETCVEESIILRGESKKQLDDQMKTIARLPRAQITVTINEPIPLGNIFSITLESIYNIPNAMSPKMIYQVGFHLPINKKTVINYTKPTYESEPRLDYQRKKWFGTACDTNYYIENDFDRVKSTLDEPIEDVLIKDHPRIEYNILKRTYANISDVDLFTSHLRKFRYVPLEIYISSIVETPKSPKKETKASKSKKGSKIGVEEKKPDCLHLMTYVDLCRLLYPGEKFTRVACPLRTYNEKEIQFRTNLEDSYFNPKPIPIAVVEVAPKKAGKAGKTAKSGKSGKSSKSSKSKKSKKSSSKKSNKGGKAKLQLPKAPPPPPASELVYNESGQQTFIIIEFELKEALQEKRDLEDLHHQLDNLLKEDENELKLPKSVKFENVTEMFYKETIKNLAEDLKHQYRQYIKETDIEKRNDLNFLKYLQQGGIYQTYMATVTLAATDYVTAAFDFKPDNQSNEYNIYISQVYVKLIELMNAAINELFIARLDPIIPNSCPPCKLLMYAHEAIELDAYGLANRYHLQRITDDETNPNYWFDYAIFHMQIEEQEKAQECAKEALKIDPNHRNALVLYAMLLSHKKRLVEAETCILNAVMRDPKWIEGWGALYCIYQRKNVPEGLEVTYEIGCKHLGKPPEMIYDLAWTQCKVPNSFYYRTTSYFISMRLYEEAEVMLASEIYKEPDSIHDYLLAVIAYYKKDYEHAILHIEKSISKGACDFTKIALKGHILSGKGDYKAALDEFRKIFELFKVPEHEYMYLVYIRTGLCCSKLGEQNKSRSAFLQANKIRDSPYSWLCTGVLYYYQGDFLAAEDCLRQSNLLDNHMPETWAYLALVNVQFKNTDEAKMCCHEMVANNLQNRELMMSVEEVVKQMPKDV